MFNIYKELKMMDDLTLQSIEMLTLGLAAESEGLRERPPSWILRIAELMKDKWNTKVTLDELALAASVHPKTVSKCFPKFFNCTFGEYRRKLKVERAMVMMKTTKMSLTEIAYECNFYDQSHFIRSFREVAGVSPKHFKRL
jgi:AraC family transcriptional regulator